MPTVALHRGPASVSVDDGEPRRLLAWNRHDPPFEDVQYATRAEVFTASIQVGPETITLDVSGEAPGPLGSTIDLTLHWRNGSTATAVGAIVDLIGHGNGGHAFRVDGYLTSPWPLLTGVRWPSRGLRSRHGLDAR
jgi:hypothetical protein